MNTITETPAPQEAAQEPHTQAQPDCVGALHHAALSNELSPTESKPAHTLTHTTIDPIAIDPNTIKSKVIESSEVTPKTNEATNTPASALPALQRRMRERQRVLDDTARQLKAELFGLDTLIDRAMDAVRAWYLLPELVERPVIVCLWGLTGTGKTQLVRRMAQLLGLYDRFVEVQMDGFSNGGQGRDSIASMLGSSAIAQGEPGILLLDEFQRFRTIDRKGEDLPVKRYQDVWQLLSDGRMAPALGTLDRIEMELAYREYEQAKDQTDAANELLDLEDDAEREKARAKRAQRKSSPYNLSVWDARDIQHALKLATPIAEIMRWTPEQVCERLQAFRANPQAWGSDYSKLLIVVTGNLDEMYQGVARRVQDCDTDADVFHEFTQRLSSIDVKQALARRFRPEQVARLGNQHLIFPSLTRAAYERLIAHACEAQLQGVRERLGLDVRLSPALLAALYQNGVFPVQGTRPVFSTVHAVLGPALAQAAVWALGELGELDGLAADKSVSELGQSGDAGDARTGHAAQAGAPTAAPLPQADSPSSDARAQHTCLQLTLDVSADLKQLLMRLQPAAPACTGSSWADSVMADSAKVSGQLAEKSGGRPCIPHNDISKQDAAVREQRLPLHLELDRLRKRAHADFRTLLAVHEAGHGLVYALLNHCAPTEVRINVASFEGGYASYAPRSAESRRMARDELCTTLAGRVAEQWVFGADAVSTGAEQDLAKATEQAARYHRHWAMGDRLSRVDVTHDTEQHLNTDVDPSNGAIEATLQAEFARAQALLQGAREPFERLVRALLERGWVDAAQFPAVTGLQLPAPKDALEPWAQAWSDFVVQAAA